jgi:hypothetical protein
MTNFENILKGDDLRSIGQSYKVVSQVNSQTLFDRLFKLLFHPNRQIVMRSADAIEKITISNPQYLKKHKIAILDLCNQAHDKELKWHLTLLVTRLKLSIHELDKVWQLLTNWATNKKESKIVRVNSIQGLYDLLKQQKSLKQKFLLIISDLENENIPSINARIKKFKI